MSVVWSVRNWARSLALLPLLVVGTAVASDSHLKSLTEHVRDANDRFKNVAAAVSEGYAPIPCASGVDGGALSGIQKALKAAGAQSKIIAPRLGTLRTAQGHKVTINLTPHDASGADLDIADDE